MDYKTLLAFTARTEVALLVQESSRRRRAVIRRIAGIETMAFPDGTTCPDTDGIIRARLARDARK